MLCGSGSAKVAKLGMTKLSTFGLLSFLKQNEVVLLIDALLATGYLEQKQIGPHRPVLAVSATGAAVMKGDAEVDGPLPLPPDLLLKLNAAAKSAAPAPVAAADRAARASSAARDEVLPAPTDAVTPPAQSAPSDAAPLDQQLYEALVSWRRERSSVEAIPPYQVFANSTLEALAAPASAHRRGAVDDQGSGTG